MVKVAKKPEYYDEDVIEFDEDKIVIRREIKLPKGKTTLEGERSYLHQIKFKEDNKCAFPERADCNSGFFYKRCKFMNFKSLGNWECVYKKDEK